MRTSQLIKTLFRTPFKTILTFLLLAALTFVLFSRVGEYSITSKEVENSAKVYHGVGSAEIAPASESFPDFPMYIYEDSRLPGNKSNKLKYQPLSRKQISSLLKLPYVSSLSTRYMTSGVSDKYYRMDEPDYYNYSARFIIEGTLSKVDYGKYFNNTLFNNLILDKCTLIAGNFQESIKNKTIMIHAFPKTSEEGGFGSLSNGSRAITTYDDSYRYNTKYVENLTIGDRYVIVGRYDSSSTSIVPYLGDSFSNPWCEAVQSVEGQPENYLKTEKFKSLNKLVELTNSDLHTFDVVYTDDMSGIMRFAEGNMAITNGRKLTKEDSDTGANVCVVSSDFASNNKLVIGDKINLKLGTELFEQYRGLGAVAATPERYSRPNKAVKLKIVGIYIDTDGKENQLKKPNWCYSINTVFVPKSLLPIDESKLDNHMFTPSEFSFTLDSAWDIIPFVKELKSEAPKLEKKGLKVTFCDSGWPDIVDKYKMSKKLSLIAIISLSLAVIASTGLIVYLYIGRKKKEYAILRALGTTKKESVKALVLPLMVLTVSAVLTGSCIAWIYTINTVNNNNILTKLPDHKVVTSIPITVAALCIFGEILLVLTFALYRVWRISNIPPLMLLQDNPVIRVHSKKLKHSENVNQINNDATVNNAPIQNNSIQNNSIQHNSIQNNPIQNNPIQNNPIHNSPIHNTRIHNTIDSQISDVKIRKDADVTLKIRINKHVRFVLRYLAKHIRRSASKSILSILLATLMFGAVGQFAVMRQSYINLCKSTDIKAKFINGLALPDVNKIINTGYVINPYYYYKHDVDFNNSKTDWVVTNDIANYIGEKTDITFAEGYDESDIKKFRKVCVVGNKLLEDSGLKLGDEVHVTVSETLPSLQKEYISKYKSDHPDEKLSDNEILQLGNKEITASLASKGQYYTIAGTITTSSDKYNRMVFSPGTFDTTPIFGQEVALDLAEFTVVDNMRVYDFRSYFENMYGKNTGEFSTDRIAFVMDTSKVDNLLKTLSLLEKLLPVVLAVAVLIGGLVCCLIVMNSSKEIAILRVLGTSIPKTLVIIILEQLFLCIVGLILGALVLIIYNGTSAISVILAQIYLIAAMYFAGCLVGSFISGVITTKGKVLGLLQTKE